MGLSDRIRGIEDRFFDWFASDRDRQRKLYLVTSVGFLLVACWWVLIGVTGGSWVHLLLGAGPSALAAWLAARNWKQLRDEQRSTRP